MKNKYLLYCIALLSTTSFVFGQKDYKPGMIITNNNDTLCGLIDMKSNYQNCRECIFIEKNEQNPKTFFPEDIKAYKIENEKYYVSKKVTMNNKTQWVFLEFMVDGIVDLYYLKESNDYYFIEKDTSIYQLSNESRVEIINDKKYLKNSNQYKSILQYVFYDSPKIKNEIATTNFNYTSLIKVTKDYHNSVCNEYECIDYSRSVRAGIFLETYVGIINSWMGLKTSSDHDFNLKPSFGFNLRIRPVKTHYLWNVMVGFNYSENNFQGYYNNTLFTEYSATYQIYSKYKIIRIPMTVEYSLPFKKIKPFVSLSYNHIFLTNIDYDINRIDEMGKVIDYNSAFRKYQFGLSGHIGLKYNFKNNSYIFLDNEFEYRRSFNNFANYLDYHYVNSWLINIGYGFCLK